LSRRRTGRLRKLTLFRDALNWRSRLRLLLLNNGLLLDHGLLKGLLHDGLHDRRADRLSREHQGLLHDRLGNHGLRSNNRLMADDRLLGHHGLMRVGL
jgi:hypothetical protein